MKKILLLLLFTVASYGQAVFDEGIQIKNNTTDNSATKVNVQSTDGTINTISKSDLVNVVEVNDVPSLPLVGEVGRIYVVKNVNKIYRWNGTFYQELAGSDISGKINLSEKGAINGVATLGSDGKVPNSQIPALAISETFPVSSQAQMLALSQADQGDVAIRSDISKSFILRVLPSSVLGNWSELLTPTSAVTTVFGRNGTVTAQTGDYNTSQVAESIDKYYQTYNQKLYNDATSSIQTQLNAKQASGSYEIAFSKNTAFNKNFGTTAGTVVEGNDGRINNGQTAFGWGNHAGLYPTYNGTGATGTWGINISGNSGSATTFGGTPFLGTATGIEGLMVYQLGGWKISTDNSHLNTYLGLGTNAYSSTPYLPLSGGTLTGIVTAPTAAPGTNTTQIATTAFVQANSSARPYKVYTALISQSGASAPTATVLENTLDGSITWSRNSVGVYLGTLANGFSSTLSKVRIFISGGEPSQNTTGFYNALPNNIDSVQVNTRNTSGSLADSLMSTGATIEIRVYL